MAMLLAAYPSEPGQIPALLPVSIVKVALPWASVGRYLGDQYDPSAAYETQTMP